jgi:hypothetical protein
MANREQTGKREKRKPKANKPKAPPQTSSFARPLGTATTKAKKGR